MSKYFSHDTIEKTFCIMKFPVFSIICPTFNRCFVLWRAIQSVLMQTYPFFELIIVDDASTDDTKKLLALFTDPRIRSVFLKKNHGPSYARNQGIKRARGKYIAYIDSDNVWHPDYLETMKEAFRKFPKKALVFCKKNYRLKVLDDKKRTIQLRDEFTGHKKYFDLKRLWQRKIIIDTNTMCHRREVVRKAGGWDEKLTFWEDFEYTLRISRFYPEGFLYVNRTLVDYEQMLDFSNRDEAIRAWEEAERYIYRKHRDHPLIAQQRWYPKEKFRSTLGVIQFLQKKHVRRDS